MSDIKRLRIFVGPNGSGKTTLYRHLVDKKAFNNYCFINADEIAESLKKSLDLAVFPLKISMNEFRAYLNKSSFQSKLTKPILEYLRIQGSALTLKNKNFSGISYISASIAEFLRKKMLSDSNSSFAFETVLSHKSKLSEIRKAKKCGYKIYLYVISTDDLNINKERVQAREKMGGHSVPLEKIQERYPRSLSNVYKAMLLSNKAFFFDNSGKEHSLIALKNDEELYVAKGILPNWFNKYILKKIH